MRKVEHHVMIGQIKVTRSGEVLKTVLGSCVGIALLWKVRGVYALAHCLLPSKFQDKNGSSDIREARFVSNTIPRMLEQMGATAADVGEIEAVVVGGGQMMEVEKPYLKFVVGAENIKAAQECLKQHHIKLLVCESGGDQGMKLRLDGSSGVFEFEKIPKSA